MVTVGWAEADDDILHLWNATMRVFAMRVDLDSVHNATLISRLRASFNRSTTAKNSTFSSNLFLPYLVPPHSFTP
jgi:hypothetical protein